uniref:Arylesterase n=1 Tax=uncultured organism TaxID=155900 RepID=G0YFD9_9ZZZZ|nr:arylesterase [uncultured organism]
MKLWCFGDSNTYGYDPCGFFGGRYAAPWPELLVEKTGFQVINDGKNGRMIPEREHEFLQFHRDAERYSADALIVMLGTNDLLEGATVGAAAARMEALLNRCDMPLVLLISPPPMVRGAWVPDDGLVEESKNLARQYEALANRLGLPYVDADTWDITLAYDGVHFTEEGHVRFAEGLASCLEGIL